MSAPSSASKTSYLVPQALQLPGFTKLSSLVLRILGQNPGPMTLGGTNTYLVGSGQQRILIDSGQGKKDYLKVLMEAISSEEKLLFKNDDVSSSSIEISKILLTHWHYDHIGGVKDVLSLFPNALVAKLPSQSHRHVDEKLTLQMTNRNSEKQQRRELHSAHPGQKFTVDGATVEVIATPGHTDDHLAFKLLEENAIFTGDCILGAGTSVFACYSDFMCSLKTLETHQPDVIYPGHGPEIMKGKEKVLEYITHRGLREEQILKTLAEAAARSQNQPEKKLQEEGEGRQGMTAMELVKAIYIDTPQQLHFAAATNVSHQLRKLWKEGRVIVALASSSSSTASSSGGPSIVVGSREEAESLLRLNEYSPSAVAQPQQSSSQKEEDEKKKVQNVDEDVDDDDDVGCDECVEESSMGGTDAELLGKIFAIPFCLSPQQQNKI